MSECVSVNLLAVDEHGAATIKQCLHSFHDPMFGSNLAQSHTLNTSHTHSHTHIPTLPQTHTSSLSINIIIHLSHNTDL